MRSPSGNETPERRVIKDYKDDTIIQQRSWKLEAFYTVKKPRKIKTGHAFGSNKFSFLSPIPTKKNRHIHTHLYDNFMFLFNT